MYFISAGLLCGEMRKGLNFEVEVSLDRVDYSALGLFCLFPCPVTHRAAYEELTHISRLQRALNPIPMRAALRENAVCTPTENWGPLS